MGGEFSLDKYICLCIYTGVNDMYIITYKILNYTDKLEKEKRESIDFF